MTELCHFHVKIMAVVLAPLGALQSRTHRRWPELTEPVSPQRWGQRLWWGNHPETNYWEAGEKVTAPTGCHALTSATFDINKSRNSVLCRDERSPQQQAPLLLGHSPQPRKAAAIAAVLTEKTEVPERTSASRPPRHLNHMSQFL